MNTPALKRFLYLAALLVAGSALASLAVIKTTAYEDDFEAYGVPGEPPGWFDSAPGNPVNEARGQFKTRTDPVVSGNTVFSKKSAASSFTHYRERTFSIDEAFSFEGRMVRTKTKAHLGVTFFSSFPSPEAYYLLALENDHGTVKLSASRPEDAGCGGSDSDSGDDSDSDNSLSPIDKGGDSDDSDSGDSDSGDSDSGDSDDSDSGDSDSGDSDSGDSDSGDSDSGDSDSDEGGCGDPLPPLTGNLDTGVGIDDDTWYRFAIDTAREGEGLRIFAKVWRDGTAEPAGWQVDAFDAAPPSSGWIGLWGKGSGTKAWDDLAVASDREPPLIRILESGVELQDGALFNRTVVPLIEVTDSSPVTVTALLDGAPFTSGDPVSAEGPHELVVNAVDAAGNSASRTVTFTLDLTPPEFVFIDPPDGFLTASGAVVLTGRVTGADSSTVNGTPLTLSGEDFDTGVLSLAEGENTFLFTAADAAGNLAQRIHRIVRDSTPPALTIDQPAAGAFLSTATVDVSGTAVDPHLQSVTVNGQPASLSGSTYSATGIGLAEGPNVLTVVAVDAVGNSAQAQITVTLDSGAPVISISESGSPLADGSLFNRSVVPEIEVTDVSPVTVETLLDGAPFTSGTTVDTEGPHTLAVSTSDAAGNSATLSVSFTIDLTPPVFGAIIPPNGTLTADPQVTLQGTVTGGAVEVTVDGAPTALSGEAFTTSPLQLAEGVNDFTLAATDAAGNRTEQVHRLERDSTPPVLTVATPVSGSVVASAMVEVTGTAVDPHLAEVRVDGTLASLTGTTFSAQTTLTDGANVLVVTATDAVGNTSQVDVAVTLDADPPSIRVLENGVDLVDGSLFDRSVTPVIEINDATEVTSVITLDGLPFVSGSEVASDGMHELSVTATDAAGNTASLVVGFEIDTAPPLFVSILPPDETVTAASEIVLEVRVTGAETASVDGQPVSLVGETFTAGPLPLAEGDNTFLLAAADAVGNAAEQTHRIVRDSTPPAVTIAQPVEGALLGTPSIMVNGTAVDERLSTVRVNGVDAAASGATFVTQQVPLAEGENTLTAIATDAAGNTGQASRTVVLDTTPPSLTITDPASGTIVPDAEIVVRGTAVDPHLERVEVDGRPAQLDGDNWSVSVDLQEGANLLVAVAFDAVGNRAEVSVTVIRDATAPHVEIRVPEEGARLLSDTVDVSGEVDDEEGITVTVNGLEATVTGGTFSALAVPLVDGENRLVARARDSVGNEGVHTRTVFRDQVAPELLFSEPSAGALAIPLGTVFELTFSEAMVAPVGAVLLATASGTPIDAEVTVVSEVLTLRPAAALPSATGLALEVTAGLTDLAGNALTNPQILTFNTVDVGVPDPPVIAPLPPPRLCAAQLEVAGFAEPGARVEVAGGAGTGIALVAEDGTFAASVDLVPESINRLSATAIDDSDNRSLPTVVEVIHDCRPPQVLSADRIGGDFLVTFDEPVDNATVTAAVSLNAESGVLAGTTTPAVDGRTATFAPLAPAPDETLRLDVARVVRDLAGNLLAFPFSRLFANFTEASFLSGTVIDDATGRPLTGARVVVTATGGVEPPEPAPEQTTGADGRFQIPMPAGTHDLLVVRPGYTPVFRVVTTVAGEGADVFDPRLVSNASTETVGVEGGRVEASGAVVDVPPGALASDTEVAATALSEQGLPALLPYGWSPRGAAWLDLGEAPLALAATLTLPVDAADGTNLEIAALDLATLQWRSLGPAPVSGGAVSFGVIAGGGFAAVEPDTGTLAPPPTVVGEPLGSSPLPLGDEVSAAALTFDPEVVLPAQTSLATVGYTLTNEPPSGFPLTLVIEESLTLLDGSLRREAPFRADLVLYRAPDGSARSRFRLRPSLAAATVPLSLGTEDVTVVPYGGETVRGDVLGPGGGSVTSAAGDVVEFPVGALAEPTAVTLERQPLDDLPLAAPAGTEIVGALRLEMGGRESAADLTLRLAIDPPPTAGESGLLLEVVDFGSGAFYRPVAAIEATASGWATTTIDPADLDWPGVRSGGLYAFARFTTDFGFLRGRVLDVAGQPLGGALIHGPSLGWIQLSAGDGTYVLPAPVGAVTVTAENTASGNAVTVTSDIPVAAHRVDLDLLLLTVGPEVVTISPPDGATDVPPGVEPTIVFSESVDRSSLAGAVELLLEGQPVAIDLDHQGALVTVLPQVTLLPGARYELRIGLGVRDLQGNPLTSPQTASFTTLRILLNEDIDVTRILLVEPDVAGMARVLGAPGAVPAGALVFAENTTSIATTTTVTADQDGSFELFIEATVQDVLLLHILGDGGSEIVVELTPFRTLDLKGAFVGPQGGRFSTGEDLIVTVPEGAFDFPTLVRLELQAPDAAAAPPPEGFEPSVAFTVDFGGAQANKGLRISVPAPAGAQEGTYLLSRVVDFFGEPRWQMDDLAVLRDGRITSEDEGVVGQEIVGLLATGIEAATREGVAGVREGGLAKRYLTVITGEGRDGTIAPLDKAGPNPREFLPGMFAPRSDTFYQYWRSIVPLGYLVLPFGPQPNMGILNGDIAYVTGVDAAIARLVPEKITIPSRLGAPFDIQIRDLTTGFVLFEDEIEPPQDEGEVVELPADTFGDEEPPRPVAGSPIRFYPLDLRPNTSVDVDLGIRYEVGEDGATTVIGEKGAVTPDVRVHLFGLDAEAAVDEFTTADFEGAFSLSASELPAGSYLLVVSAKIASGESLEIAFSEALADGFAGIEVYDGLSVASPKVDVDLEPVGSRETVRITPPLDWRRGETYTLRLAPELADDAGNRWQRDLEVRFEVQESRPLDVYNFGDARSVARLGSLLFVAAGPQGIAVLDASDPANLRSFIDGDVTFTFPFRGSVRGVTLDPHGRLIVTGGGDATLPGLLRVYDPLRLDPEAIAANPSDPDVRGAWFMGSTIVTNNAGGSFDLPLGTPRRTAILSNDETAAWQFGEEAPPAGVSVTPTMPPADFEEEVTVTVTGNDGTEVQPVTLRNLTAGRFDRVDAAEDTGAYTVSVRARRGDRLELLRSRNSVAYVAVSGSGVAAVDVNAVYQEKALGPNQTISDVLNFFLGGASAGGVSMSTIANIGLLLDPANPVPLAIPTGHLFNGFVGLQAPFNQPAAMQVLLTDPLLIDGSQNVIGLEVLQKFVFDLDGDGDLEASEARDYLVLGHPTGGILIFDVTERSQLVRKARIRMPGTINHVSLDRANRRVYAAGYNGGLYVVDLGDRLSDELLDANSDGVDDRLLETVELDGNTRSPMQVVSDLGLLYVGGGGPGLHAIATDGPRLAAVVRGDDGELREITRVAPFGVPSVRLDPNDPESPMLPGSFRVVARLPGSLGEEVRLDVVGLGPSGAPIFPAGDPDNIENLPAPRLEGEDGLVLRRLSDDPKDEAYQVYRSEELALLADLRASRHYQRSEMEDEQCRRCDLDAEKVSEDAVELISGIEVAIRFGADLRQKLSAIYDDLLLDAAEISLASVPWDISPAVRQEPTLNPSYGAGDAVPGTLLHSGEMTTEGIDLHVSGRGFDFAIERTYRSQTVGSGPLGPGWDHLYRQRLRPLPNGDVEYFDGRGRCEVFEIQDDDTLKAPEGRFWRLERNVLGWVLVDQAHNIIRFDRFGRLASMSDAVRLSADSGNEMTFHYDLSSNLSRVVDSLDRSYDFEYDDAGRLTEARDFDGREVAFAYDVAGRLVSVTTPAIESGLSTFPDGLVTRYSYETGAGDLAVQLNTRDNLASITDAKDQTWLELSYTDADGDGRPDEVTGQTWGGSSLSIDYQFEPRTATVTDRRGNANIYTHNADGQMTRHDDPAGAVTSYVYDDEGLITSSTSAMGRQTALTYDTTGDRRSRGNPRTISLTADSRGGNGSPDTVSTQIQYHSRTNQPIRIIDARGAITSIDRGESGLPTKLTRAFGTSAAMSTTITYNRFGQPKTVTDATGSVTTYEYFESGDSEGYLRQVTGATGSLGLTSRYETDPRGNITATIDGRGVRHESTFNELDWQTGFTVAASGSDDGAPALNYTSSFLYDANGNITEQREPFGDEGSGHIAVRFSYGQLDELLSIDREIVPGGTTVSMTREYDPNLNVTVATDPLGHRANYAYDARNLLISLTRGAGTAAASTETYGYNLERQRESFTDGRGHGRLSVYDGFGRPMGFTDPLGNRATTSYDAVGNVMETQRLDAGGEMLARGTAEFDLLDRRTATTTWLWDDDPGAARQITSRFEYDAAGNLRKAIDPMGRETTFGYDPAHRLTSIVDPLGNRVDETVDAMGHVTARSLTERLPDGGFASSSITMEYDALGRQSRSRDAFGNSMSFIYDARGNLRFAIDAEGNFTENTYDGLDRRLSTVRPEGVRLEYEFDVASRLVAVSDAVGRTTRWDYDALGRKRQTTFPDGTREQFSFDAAGNVTAMIDPRGTTLEQVFDAAGRITSRLATPADGETLDGPLAETFVYDGLNRPIRAISGGVVSELSYDSLSRLRAETTGGRTVGYDHDDLGSVTQIGYPSGLSVARTYDQLNRPATIGSASYGYRGPDLVSRRDLGNGLTGNLTFDAARRLVDQTYRDPGGATVFQETTTWSPRGLKVGISRGDLNGAGLSLAYDPAGRLLAAGRATGIAGNNSTTDPAVVAGLPDGFGFTYDAGDNLRSRRLGTAGVERNVDLPLDADSRPLSVNGETLQWDANGNLVGKGDLELHYDFQNRLTRVTSPQGEVASYTYDVFNRRIAKTVGGVTEETVWGGWQPLEDYRGGQLRSRRTFGLGLDEVVRVESDLTGDGSLSDYVPFMDDTGSLAFIADAAGKPIERYDYSPFGERTIRVDSTPPEVEQARLRGGELWLEISEQVLLSALEAARSTGGLRLTDTDLGEDLEISLSQPVTDGRQAGRRVVLTPAEAPAAGAALELVIAASALVDLFANTPAEPLTLAFTWSDTDTVLVDTAAPRVELVVVREDGTLEIELSEEADPTSAISAISIPGQSLSFDLGADLYTLTSTQPLPAGTYQLTISRESLDLAGAGLAEPFVQSITVDGVAALAFTAEDPRETDQTTVGNNFAFHCQREDPETGLVYFRNRYFDPDLGGFVSEDPFLYRNGPNPRQFGLHSPYVLADPFGTRIWGFATARNTRVNGRNIGSSGYAFYDLRGDCGPLPQSTSGGACPGSFDFLDQVGDRLVIHVHGYNNNLPEFRRKLDNVEYGFTNVALAEQQLYGFTWKGDPLGQPLSAPFFWWSESNADLSAVAFADLIRDIRTEVGWGQMDLFATTHSLGARVALRGLQTLAAWNRGQRLWDGGNALDGLFMMNAAVTNRAIQPGGFLEEAFNETTLIRSYFSAQDPVLKKAFRLAKVRKALGSASIAGKMGAVGPLRNPRNYADFDMTNPAVAGSVVDSHSQHLLPATRGLGAADPWALLWRHLADQLDAAAVASRP